MTNILVYDDTEEMLVRLAEKYDMTIAELLDEVLDEENIIDSLDDGR